MKKKYIFLQFALVFLFFVLPPLLISGTQVQTPVGTLSWMIAVEALLALVLEIQQRKLFTKKTDSPVTQRFIYSLSFGTITLGLLMLSFAALQAISIVFPSLFRQNTVVARPETVPELLCVLLTFAVSAFYEEVLYRQYVPFVALYAAGNVKPLRLISEIVCVLVFAFSHRYLGWSAVINAFICGIILRWCYVKTQSVIPGSIAHFVYNVTVYAFLMHSLQNT